MSSTSTRRFKVGDKVKITDAHGPRGLGGNLRPGYVTKVTAVSDDIGCAPCVFVADYWGSISENWLLPADGLFTDGREKFKPGDKIRSKWSGAEHVVTRVCTDPDSFFSLRFTDDRGDNGLAPKDVDLVETPAPATSVNSPYELLGAEIGRLVADKQLAYGDSFSKSGDVLAILYPDGVKPEQYGDLLTVTRILDKVFRICSRKDAFGESPYKDLAGYSLLAAVRDAKGGAK